MLDDIESTVSILQRYCHCEVADVMDVQVEMSERQTEKGSLFATPGPNCRQTRNPEGSMTTLRLAAIFMLFQGTGNPAQSPVHEQHIQRIQSHIISPGIGKSASDGPSLSAHMVDLRVPGVSIAVIQNGEIAWARGFGVT